MYIYVRERRWFEWEKAKARSNLAKHGVSFELARRVWEDPLHIVVPDRVESGEQRWHALGLVGPVMVLLVVHQLPRSRRRRAGQDHRRP